MKSFTQGLLRPSLCVLFFVLVFASVGFAGEHGHEPSILDLKFKWINFFLYVGALYYLLRSPLKKTWLARRDSILNSVNAARGEQEAAQRELRLAESKIAGLNADIAKLNIDIEREAGRESEAALADARQRSQRIAAQAKLIVEGERKATEALIRRELLDLAIAKAEQRLKGELSVDADRSLRDTALSSVRSLVQ